MATATSEGVPAAHHRLAGRLRAAVLGPRGGGTTRRRASDAFRLGLADLNVQVADITRAPRQVWGVEQFTGRDPAGRPVELSVYGRDASDAGVLAKLWRFGVYRDSGPTLIMDRLQQVEHEAYLTLMTQRAGVGVPDVLAAGRFGPSSDAALVTRVPDGLHEGSDVRVQSAVACHIPIRLEGRTRTLSGPSPAPTSNLPTP